MKSTPLIFILGFLFHVINPFHSFSQDDIIQLNNKKRLEIIEKVSEIYLEYYPLPEVSKKMADFLKRENKLGNYNQFDNVNDFTSQLTKDLCKVSHDDHIRVSPYQKIPDDLLVETKLGYPENNYGFQKVEVLPGNIGYLNLTTFNNPKTAGLTAIAAMNFVANSKALIIDLRINGGGDEAMAQLISSYFFDKSTHLSNDFVYKDSITEQIWTQEWVPGKRITEAPIYILMSNYSYSSSEAMAYQLQQLKRAKIVGEKTRGGSHGVRYMSFPETHINLKVPYSQEVNPYSKTNYINGVIPDIPCNSEQALTVAQLEAALELLKTETDSLTRYKLEWLVEGNKIELTPIILDSSMLFEYQGKYKNVSIWKDCNRLMFQRDSTMIQELIPMGNDIFKYMDLNQEKYRIQFTRNKKGIIDGLYEFDSDGDKYPIKQKNNK
jgi:retinol-binding protein 3